MSDLDTKYEKLGELLRRLPKEELSKDFDPRFWKRFEEEKFKPAGSPQGAFVLSGCLLFAALLFFMVIHTSEKPTVLITSGDISHSQHVKLQKGDRFITGSKGWAILELEHHYQIQVNPGSEIEVRQLKHRLGWDKTVFYLAKGQMLISIGQETHVKYPMEILTPNAFARAMGTQFMVSAPSAIGGLSQVSVLKGVVRVGSTVDQKNTSSGWVPVVTGQEIRIAQTSGPLAAQKMSDKNRQELEELFQFSKKNRVILLISMGKGRVRELLKPCPIYFQVQPEKTISRQLQEVASSIQEASEDADHQKHLEAAEELEKTIEEQTDLQPTSTLLFVASYYAYLGEYQRSADLFEKIASDHPDSQFSSLALLGATVVYHDKLDFPEKAASLAAQILKKYPDSYEAEEAKEFLKS